MLCEKNGKLLRGSCSRRRRILGISLISLVAIFCFVVGLINLCLSYNLAKKSDTTLIGLIKDDVSHFYARDSYPRIYIQAYDHYVTGTFQISMSIVVVIFGIFAWKWFKLNERIINHVNSK